MTTTVRILLPILLIALSQSAGAQTADDYIIQGRSFLSVSNLIAANNSFSAALALSPNHQTGNLFYAVTRLLVWPNQPPGSNFLTRLGVPLAGRNIYQWTALPPVDTNGIPLAPAEVNANESTAIARTNLLPALIASEANLAKVVDRGFTLELTGGETLAAHVTLDYGDVLMLRSILCAAEYACYTICPYNVDMQLAAIRALATDPQSSAETALRDYPDLFTLTTTNDLNAAKMVLQKSVDLYLAASDVIRTRPTNVVRLFNYTQERAADEEKFRLTLGDLTNSLNRVVPLTIYSNIAVSLRPQFSGAYQPRAFLPVVSGNGFGLGTLPDPTFGGAVYDSTPGTVELSVERFLARGLFPIPTINPNPTRSSTQIEFQINTLRGRGYVVEVSADLMHWAPFGAFVSFQDGYSFVDTGGSTPGSRYYRVADCTTNMPPPPNDNFANRIPLTGLGITTVGYNAGASTEVDEPFSGGPATVWWSWTATGSGMVVVGTVGGTVDARAQVYTGAALTTLTLVASANRAFFATAGTTYHIQVCGNWAEPGGGIQLQITAPPVLAVNSPAAGTISTVVTNFSIQASAVDPDGSIAYVACYVDGALFGTSAGSSLNLAWKNVPPAVHSVIIAAADNLGATTLSNLTVIVRPPNDNFASRISIAGASASLLATNSGGSKEPGEPAHAGDWGGNSVWWSWTAPFTGPVTVAAGLDPFGQDWGIALLAIYTGSVVSNLVEVASASQNSGRGGIPAQVSFVATAGVAYQIAVDGQFGLAGTLTLRLVPTEPPEVGIDYPPNGAAFTVPTSLVVVASAHDNDGTIRQVDFYDYPCGIYTVSNAPYFVILTNLVGGTAHMLVAKATDNMGVSTWSEPVSVRLTFPETTLTSNIPVLNLSGQRESQAYYNINVSTNVTQLQIMTFGGSGDCDLYVAFGYQPSLYAWHYRPYIHGNNETVTIDQPAAGDWHIMLNGWDAYAGVMLRAWTW